MPPGRRESLGRVCAQPQASTVSQARPQTPRPEQATRTLSPAELAPGDWRLIWPLPARAIAALEPALWDRLPAPGHVCRLPIAWGRLLKRERLGKRFRGVAEPRGCTPHSAPASRAPHT